MTFENLPPLREILDQAQHHDRIDLGRLNLEFEEVTYGPDGRPLSVRKGKITSSRRRVPGFLIAVVVIAVAGVVVVALDQYLRLELVKLVLEVLRDVLRA